jgi:hypothetical protein
MRLGDQIAQGDSVEELMYPDAKVFPQLMCQAGFVTMAILFAATTGSIDILFGAMAKL